MKKKKERSALKGYSSLWLVEDVLFGSIQARRVVTNDRECGCANAKGQVAET